MEALADKAVRCDVCGLPLDLDVYCGNPLCNSNDRWFVRNYAIAMRSGVLEAAINAYKYDDRQGWAIIFGRVLAGYLDEEAVTFRRFDLIVSSPTFVGEGGRSFDHTRLVLQRAAAELPPPGSWPFDLQMPPAIVKTAATPGMVKQKGFKDRRAIAEGELRISLQVSDPNRTRGKAILVYDDVFTDGLTLREVARALRSVGGASSVSGITLCRQPFRGRQKPNPNEVPF